jgi:glycosyltransferase involved in cell wall biosynthesis
MSSSPTSAARNAPRVSAIVSTYNSERFMRGCLDDLCAQTIFSAIEVIVIESASPQNEGAIVREFQRRHPNIFYHRTESRECLYAAWNRALKLARAPYVTNANTDDRHAPDAFEKLAATLDARPDVGVVYGATAITEQENATLSNATLVGQFKARRFDRRRLFWDCLPGPQPMWRRALHDEFGFFDESFFSAGDYEFWLRISAKVKFAPVREVLGLFLKSPSSISHSNEERAAEESERARALHWPAAWGARPASHRSLLNRLTRRSTYREWWQRVRGQ